MVRYQLGPRNPDHRKMVGIFAVYGGSAKRNPRGSDLVSLGGIMGFCNLCIKMAYFTYILQSKKDGSYYIGSTLNIEERVKRHNAGKERYSSRGIPWQLVCWEQFETRSEAYKREMEIKGHKSRAYIERLISLQNSAE
ncbi:GIY-YIG nuclease family protein [Williamwhitmania taraxaci]|uniref:GIY-YIG nuclease family protein n=1 Tax=Williamwhitmania taraxaci TaxID=1640674 RepID=UPI001BB02640|nr:GIY-YIG nuclease family protein [Williamwhitmania taraxaci]